MLTTRLNRQHASLFRPSILACGGLIAILFVAGCSSKKKKSIPEPDIPETRVSFVTEPDGHVSALCYAGRVTAESVAKLQKKERLTEVAFQECKAFAADALAGLSKVKALTSVDFLNCPLSDSDVAHVAGIKGLVSLKLMKTGVTGKGVSKLKGLASLVKLSLRAKSGDAAMGQALGSMPELQTLDLIFQNVGAFKTADLKSMTGLRQLVFGSEDLRDEHLDGFPVTLESLHLQRPTSIADAGAAHLKKVTNLKSLSLAGAAITDAGLADLATLAQLESLDIAGCRKLTPTALKHLSAHKALKKLTLTASGVKGEGLKHLHTVRTLVKIEMGRSQAGRAAAALLRKALPNCTVELVDDSMSAPPPTNGRE